MPFIGQKIETTSDDFGDLIRKNCLVIDKTWMIKEFIEGAKVSLIIRPRRFGKTINLSMLQHFLSREVAGMSTSGLFDDLAIAKEEDGEFLKKHQGQYPVIFITFKDAKEPSFEQTVSQLRNLMQEVYREHMKILLSDKLEKSDKNLFIKYMEGSVNHEELQKALKLLSELLYKAYGKKVIILIDEYDSPYNLEVYTLLNKKYRQYFGFTEDEVKALVHYTKNDENLEKIKSYYNGYNMGDLVIYNPWSTMKFLDQRELLPYWVVTSNDKLLQNIFLDH